MDEKKLEEEIIKEINDNFDEIEEITKKYCKKINSKDLNEFLSEEE